MAHWKVPFLFGDQWQVDFRKPDSGLDIREGEFGRVSSINVSNYGDVLITHIDPLWDGDQDP